jgi:hypothetical protein
MVEIHDKYESYQMMKLRSWMKFFIWMELNNLEILHLDENEHVDDEENTWMKLNDTNVVDHMVEN